MGLNQMLITIGIISIFSLAFINFGIQFGIDQNASININSKSTINDTRNSVVDNSNDFIINSNTTEDVIQSSTIEDTSQSGSFSKITIFTNPLTKPFKVLKDMFSLIGTTIFGGNQSFGVVLGIITTIIGLIILFAGYKLLKGGNPD